MQHSHEHCDSGRSSQYVNQPPRHPPQPSTHPVQQNVARQAEVARENARRGCKKGKSAAARAEREKLAAAERVDELRPWTETLGGEGDANQYVIIATRDDRRYATNES